MSPNILFCSNVVTGYSLRFIQSKYNSVSRGQSAIIQGFQVIIRGQSGGMRAAGYLPSARETDIKPANHVEERIGLRCVSHDSDKERSTNYDLVIPSPFELSDSDGDGVSPRQYKLAMQKQLAHKNVAPNSTSDSDEEEALVVEEGAEQSIDGQSGTSFESKSSSALFSKIAEMSRQLA
jgi:hypothetical protein